MATPINHGRSWSVEQDAWLMKAIRKKDIDVCAHLLQRTPGSVRSRLLRLAALKVQSGEWDLNMASASIRMPANTLDEYIQKHVASSPVKTKNGAKETFYAVRRGHAPGIYLSWQECQAQLLGFQGTSYKRFSTREEAEAFLYNNDTTAPLLQPKADACMSLSDEQKHVLDAIFEQKRSVFLTGPAGTGKSVTLREIVQKAHVSGLKIGVTAMTGAAGYLIHGKTLHSYLGIGLGKRDALYLAKKTIRSRPDIQKMLQELDILVIDEVSMLGDGLFENVSQYLQHIRGSTAPFGGVQLLLCGDMCQLASIDGTYCFLSKEWSRLEPYQIVLTKVFRQDKDAEFKEMLMRLRYGRCSDEDLARLKACQNTKFPDSVVPTRMFALVKDVERINQEEYDKVRATAGDGEILTFRRSIRESTARHGSPWTHAAIKRFAEVSGIPETIELCKGAQVVVTRNIQNTELVNGTRGVVQHMDKQGVTICTVRGEYVTVPMLDCLMEDDPTACIRYLPLKYAWAISIHKSQGMTLDCMEVDLGESIFAYGQAYTALSRARNLESVRIVNIKKTSFRTHPAVLSLYGVI
jgi:ATP-dependent DNA helicase PIF1